MGLMNEEIKDKYPYLCEEMTLERLKKDYPYLCEDITYEAQSGNMVAYTVDWLEDLPEGWHNIFLSQYCDKINEVLGDNQEAFHIEQLKEKFGEIRCYWSLDPDKFENAEAYDSAFDKLMNLTDDIENLSYETCCYCGAKATVRSKGYILPYCDSCKEKRLSPTAQYIKISD